MSTRFARNLAFNIIGPLVPPLVALPTVPLYIHTIGLTRYGILAIVWVLVGSFGFLDFGLATASTNALSRLGDAKAEARAPVLVTVFYLTLLFGLVASLVFYLLGGLFLRYGFSLSGHLRGEVLSAFPWIVPMLPLGMAIGVAAGAMESRERFLLSNSMRVGGNVLGQVIPLVAVFRFGPSLGILLPTLVMVQLGQAVAMVGTVVWLERPIRSVLPRWSCARGLFAYGMWVTVSGVLAPLLTAADQMLIGHLLGAKAVALYAVPMKFAGRTQILAAALSRTLFPRLSREDVAVGRQLTANAAISLIYILGAMCGPAMIVAGPFLRLWIGPEFAQDAYLVAEILLFGAWANGVAFMPYIQLQAQGRPRVTAYVHAVEVIPFLVGLWFLMRWAGLPGAALAWSLRVGADCVVLMWIAGCMRGAVRRALPGLALMVACFLIAWRLTPRPEVALGIGVGFGVLFVGCGVALEATVRNAIRGAVAAMTRPRQREITVR